MARKNNRICIVCAKEYAYCNSCSEDRHLAAWHTIYCCQNCKDIFNVASSYFANEITTEEARDKFNMCDLSNKDKFHHKIIEAINEVHGIPVRENKNVEPVVETTATVIAQDIVVEENVDSSNNKNTETFPNIKYGKHSKKK